MQPWRLVGARGTLIVAAAGLLSACGPREAPRAAESATDSAAFADEAVARARTAANGLGQELQSRLFAALDSGGPVRAIGICSDSAQAWTARHAREGVYVRRVSLRVRNPRNAPDSTETRDLLRLDSLQRAGAMPGEIVRFARAAGGRQVVEYMRPIVVQERCLACHGERDAMQPAVRSLLDQRYPDDQATGYRAGDLRGMLSVRAPLHTSGEQR